MKLIKTYQGASICLTVRQNTQNTNKLKPTKINTSIKATERKSARKDAFALKHFICLSN